MLCADMLFEIHWHNVLTLIEILPGSDPVFINGWPYVK